MKIRLEARQRRVQFDLRGHERPRGRDPHRLAALDAIAADAGPTDRTDGH